MECSRRYSNDSATRRPSRERSRFGKVQKMKICSYTMTVDTGFAPNPFHGYCTVAACTPNHMNSRLVKGDLLAGFFTDRGCPYLAYFMEVEEVLDYDAYYRDPRFQNKKPRRGGSWRECCGDNMYHRHRSGKWIRSDGPYHQDDETFKQDTRYAVVYIGQIFGYFGRQAYEPDNELPRDLQSVLKKGQGIKYTRSGDRVFDKYCAWLKMKAVGVMGEPRNRGVGLSSSCGSKDMVEAQQVNGIGHCSARGGKSNITDISG